MTKKMLKILMSLFIVLGTSFAMVNIVFKEINASGGSHAISFGDGGFLGTLDEDGNCVGAPTNCGISNSISPHFGGSSSIREFKRIKNSHNVQKKINTRLNIVPEIITISIKTESLIKPGVFCVTEDGLIMIPDATMGNIKAYGRGENGFEIVQTIGQKGYRSEEFAKPSFCFYDKNKSELGVMDLGKKTISFFDRVGKTEFIHTKEIVCLRSGSDFHLSGNKLYISGYISDQEDKKKGYDFYFIDLDKNEKISLLPSYLKYGLKSNEELRYKYYQQYSLPAIGTKSWFSIRRGEAFFTWEGDLKIIKLNIAKGYSTSFGKKTSHYISPTASKNFIKEYRSGNFKHTRNEKAKMSYVRGIFVSLNQVFVIYKGPAKEGNGSVFRLQRYTTSGEFLEEIKLPGPLKYESLFHFDEESGSLYSLSSHKQNRPDYFIVKYKIRLSAKKG